MNLRSLGTIRFWKDLAWEGIKKTCPGPQRVYPLSWNLDPWARKVSHISWPSQYSWPACHKWVTALKLGLQELVHLETTDIPQPKLPIVCFTLEFDGESQLCVLDYSDYPAIDESHADKALVYFKMQYARDGYGRSNVVPGGFVPNDVDLYYYLASLRRRADMRSQRYEVYGRFSLDFAKDIRQKALSSLCNQKRFSFEGSPRRIRYSRFLRETAASKICIDLPGNGDFCFRLIDYLAVGTCIVGPPHGSILHRSLEDRTHVVYCKPDLSDLVDLCEYYLTHDEERDGLRANSREFFDRFLRPEQLAAYYLHTCYSRISSSFQL